MHVVTGVPCNPGKAVSAQVFLLVFVQNIACTSASTVAPSHTSVLYHASLVDMQTCILYFCMTF